MLLIVQYNVAYRAIQCCLSCNTMLLIDAVNDRNYVVSDNRKQKTTLKHYIKQSIKQEKILTINGIFNYFFTNCPICHRILYR